MQMFPSKLFQIVPRMHGWVVGEYGLPHHANALKTRVFSHQTILFKSNFVVMHVW